MVHASDGFGLSAEPVHGGLVGDGAEAEDLEGDPAVEGGLLGLVDDAHAAVADFSEDAEFAELGGGNGGAG